MTSAMELSQFLPDVWKREDAADLDLARYLQT
jgi:hypothetical protein